MNPCCMISKKYMDISIGISVEQKGRTEENNVFLANDWKENRQYQGLSEVPIYKFERPWEDKRSNALWRYVYVSHKLSLKLV